MISITESVSRKTQPQIRYEQDQTRKQNAILAGIGASIIATGIGRGAYSLYKHYNTTSEPSGKLTHVPGTDIPIDSVLNSPTDDSILNSKTNDSILDPSTDDSIFNIGYNGQNNDANLF